VESLLEEDLGGFGLEGGDVGVFEYGGKVNVWLASQPWSTQRRGSTYTCLPHRPSCSDLEATWPALLPGAHSR
jgi:hypothetical protein